MVCRDRKDRPAGRMTWLNRRPRSRSVRLAVVRGRVWWATEHLIKQPSSSLFLGVDNLHRTRLGVGEVDVPSIIVRIGDEPGMGQVSLPLVGLSIFYRPVEFPIPVVVDPVDFDGSLALVDELDGRLEVAAGGLDALLFGRMFLFDTGRWRPPRNES